MAATLTSAETAELTSYLRDRVDSGARASRTAATLFLRAVRPDGPS
jgi:hypothetical protein